MKLHALLAGGLLFNFSTPEITLSDTLPTNYKVKVSCPTAGGVSTIPDHIWKNMQGVSWHRGMGCPNRDQLRYLRLPYLDFNHQPQMGEMVIARSAAEDVFATFNRIFCSRDFMIAKMRLVYHYDGNDNLSMNDNNTSAFNCRLTTSGTRLSEHSFGLAIDINPVQNPYVSKGKTLPELGLAYDTKAERLSDNTGVIRKHDVVTNAFGQINWKWGGLWKNSKDYQHFSASGK